MPGVEDLRCFDLLGPVISLITIPTTSRNATDQTCVLLPYSASPVIIVFSVGSQKIV